MRYGVRHLLTGTVMFSLGILPSLPAVAQPAAVPVSQSGAGGPQATAPAARSRAEVESYIGVMKSELERSEARVAALTAQLVALDGDIESRVNRIVSLLSSVRDSTDASGTRLRMAKEEALEGLKAAAKYYAQERDRRKKEMGTTFARADDDALARDVAVLNALIETRVTQSLDIAASLVQHEEGQIERYRDWDNESTETREFRRRQRDAESSVQIKSKLVADLRASIDKLTRDVRMRENDLLATKDPQVQERLSKDIESLRQTIDARRSQIEEVLSAPRPATRVVNSSGAFEMVKLIDEMRRELRQDFMRFKSLVSDRDAARARLGPLKERLDRAVLILEAMNRSPVPDAGIRTGEPPGPGHSPADGGRNPPVPAKAE